MAAPADPSPTNDFVLRTKKLQEALRTWHLQNFKNCNEEMEGLKAKIIKFDQKEEQTPLSQDEFSERIKLRERVFELANVIEERWRQRARCKWLREGDKNTCYFHAKASARCRRNRVEAINSGDGRIVTGIQIKDVFLQHLISSLGQTGSTLNFRPEALYVRNEELSDMNEPFSYQEVTMAVKALAPNKASGPDGLTSEFMQKNWIVLSAQVMEIMQAFHANSIDLSLINKANVVFIPKKDSLEFVTDFRPISIVNIVPKLISKILASRLACKMPELISPYQTACIKGRQISENFNATRELLHHITDTGSPAVLLKVDFAKAFDSIEWPFLLQVLATRGFSQVWIGWFKQILNTTTSKVINGEASAFFKHHRGLRQGDPLSPLLFNLAVDVLQRMVGVVNANLPVPISTRMPESIIVMQYADDTAVVANANVSTMATLKIIFRIFTKLSGLRVNFAKSSFVPFNLSSENVSLVKSLLGCSLTTLPMNYLGMPLTVQRPNRQCFYPLIEKIEKRLEGWKGKLISRGGRLQLINLVMSSIPVYFMACFRLPKWVINQIDKIRRDFLWKRNEGPSQGVHLISWDAMSPEDMGWIWHPGSRDKKCFTAFEVVVVTDGRHRLSMGNCCDKNKIDRDVYQWLGSLGFNGFFLLEPVD